LRVERNAEPGTEAGEKPRVELYSKSGIRKQPPLLLTADEGYICAVILCQVRDVRCTFASTDYDNLLAATLRFHVSEFRAVDDLSLEGVLSFEVWDVWVAVEPGGDNQEIVRARVGFAGYLALPYSIRFL
jgi:hypothetical protein